MQKLATIEKIEVIQPHPGADLLEIAICKNLRCVVKKDTFVAGDWCILIQPDTVLPDAPWAEFYRRGNPTRVKAMRLRGIWSWGIVETLDILYPRLAHMVLPNVGEDVSELLGIIKFEEPEPQEEGAESGFPHWLRKTGEDNFQSIPLQERLGKLVDVTLKADGKSCTEYNYNGTRRRCGRRLVFSPDADSIYNQAMGAIKPALDNFFESNPTRNYAFRGEIVGEGASRGKNNPFTGKPTQFLLFGIYDCDTFENFGPLSPYYFGLVGALFGIPMVPIIEKQVPLTMELIEKYQNLEKLNGEFFEGVVIVGEDFSFKVINLNYDSKK